MEVIQNWQAKKRITLGKQMNPLLIILGVVGYLFVGIAVAGLISMLIDKWKERNGGRRS